MIYHIRIVVLVRIWVWIGKNAGTLNLQMKIVGTARCFSLSVGPSLYSHHQFEVFGVFDGKLHGVPWCFSAHKEPEWNVKKVPDPLQKSLRHWANSRVLRFLPSWSPEIRLGTSKQSPKRKLQFLFSEAHSWSWNFVKMLSTLDESNPC